MVVNQTYTFNINYDTISDTKHAYDYLTSYNRTVLVADPCAGATCIGAADSFPIPPDTSVGGPAAFQADDGPQFITMWGGDITDVQYVGTDYAPTPHPPGHLHGDPDFGRHRVGRAHRVTVRLGSGPSRRCCPRVAVSRQQQGRHLGGDGRDEHEGGCHRTAAESHHGREQPESIGRNTGD